MLALIRVGSAIVLSAIGVLAFANAPIGTVLENLSMPSLEGGQDNLLGDTNVSVFIFIKPGLEHSHTALVQIAECQKELAGKPVHWTAVVSSRVPKGKVAEEVKKTGLCMPVLIDEGDVLYGKLGVTLHPVIGITDPKQKLVSYEPFTKVNYSAVVRARILHALKEITDQELEQVLKPPAVEVRKDASIAHRYFKLAEKQFQAEQYGQALTNISRSLNKIPTPAAHALRGRVLAAQGQHAQARAAFEAALKLDPKDSTALEGINSVSSK